MPKAKPNPPTKSSRADHCHDGPPAPRGRRSGCGRLQMALTLTLSRRERGQRSSARRSRAGRSAPTHQGPAGPRPLRPAWQTGRRDPWPAAESRIAASSSGTSGTNWRMGGAGWWTWALQLVERAAVLRAAERGPAAEELVERAAQAVEVGADIDRAAVGGLLRGHVVGRAHRLARAGHFLAGSRTSAQTPVPPSA